MPVALTLITAILHVSLIAYRTLLRFSVGLYQSYLVVSYSLILFLLTIAVHALRRLVSDLRKVENQLKGFSIARSDCYCCSHSHRDPHSGVRLPCDRRAVYKTLKDS